MDRGQRDSGYFKMCLQSWIQVCMGREEVTFTKCSFLHYTDVQEAGMMPTELRQFSQSNGKHFDLTITLYGVKIEKDNSMN